MLKFAGLSSARRMAAISFAVALAVQTTANAASDTQIGADGPDGTSASINGENGQSVSADASNSVPDASNSATAVGGNGGAGFSGVNPTDDGGTGGNGGDGAATAIVTDAVSGAATITLTATGGNGGGGGNPGAGGNPGDGGNGGNADSLGIQITNATADPVTVLAALTAGNGGDSNFGTGGNGGLVSFGDTSAGPTVTATSTTGGDVTVSALANGGNAGNSLHGVAADALTLTLTNIVGGSTSGNLTLTQTANAGNGGNITGITGGTASAGGNANNTLSFTDNVASNIIATLHSTGGNGGNINAAGIAGNGGDANANLSLSAATSFSTRSNVTLSAFATAGAGGIRTGSATPGNGGNATVTMNDQSTNSNVASRDLHLLGTSIGGDAHSLSSTPNVTGGQANTDITGTIGGGIVFVVANATGGSAPGGFGGSSFSNGTGIALHAVGFGSPEISIQSTATAGTGHLDGVAIARATGIGQSAGNISISAVAIDPASSFSNTPNMARAEATALTSTGGISATSNMGNAAGIGRPVALVSLNAYSPSSFSLAPTITAKTLALYAPSTIAFDHGPTLTASSDFYSAPNGIQTLAALAASPHVRAALIPGGLQDFGLGTLLFNSYSDGPSGTTVYGTSASFYLDPTHIASTGDLYLGFLDASANDTGGIFSLFFRVYELQGPDDYVNLTFTSVTSAQTYFNDNPLDLGTVSSLHTAGGKIDLGIMITVVTNHPDNSLAIDYILANKVPNPTPEPTSLSLLAAAFPLLLKRRR